MIAESPAFMRGEFVKARLESDAAFAARFADVSSEEEFFECAKAEGYDLEHLSDEELDMVAGGGFWDKIKKFAKDAYTGIGDIFS